VNQHDTLDLINKRIPRRGSTSSRLLFEQSWIRDLFMFGGKHHIAIVGNQIHEIPPLENEVRYKANFIKPAVIRAVTKIMNIQGRFGVAPDGSSLKALNASRMSEQVFQHLRTQTGYQREKMYALLWAACCGTSFLKNVYDPHRGDNQRFFWMGEQDRRVMPSEFLSPQEQQRKSQLGWFDDYPVGDVSCEAVSPLQIYEDPMSKGKLEHCRYIFQQQWLPKDWVSERFGIDGNDLQVDTYNHAAARFEDALALMNTSITGQYFTMPSEEREGRERVRLLQMWERPSRAFPKGRYVVLAGDTVIRDLPNPYVADQTGVCHLPFVKLDWFSMPGRFWGLSLVSDLVNPQFRYNESRARHAEFEKIFGRPITLMPKGSGLAKDGMELRAGGVYEYNAANGNPMFVPQPTLPPEVLANAQNALGELRSLSAQSDIDAARLPGQLRSGLALNTIQKERDIVLDHTTMNSLESDAACGKQFLALAKLFYTSERLVAMRGSNGEWAVKAFQAADIRNDVRVIGEPGEYETSEQFQNRLIEFIQTGVLQPATNSQDKQMLLKALKFHTTEEIMTDYTQHEERQEEEIRRMALNPKAYADKPYPVLPFEDDAAHMRVLERFMNNLDEFDKLDPMAQSVIKMHWEMHNQQQSMKQANALQMMAAQRGAPGQKGVASQPAPG